MGLDKGIFYGKEHRKPYYDSRRFDMSCRNHGNHGHGPGNECPWCKANRLHNTKVKEEQSADALAHAFDEDTDYCEGCLEQECLNCPFNIDNSQH